jgi:chromosome segregation ATPase
MLKYQKIFQFEEKVPMNIFEKLDTKIDELLQRVTTLQSENETLRQELVNIKAQCEVKTAEIQRLEALNAQKDQEIEEIVSKIESMIG